jgi:hypothetical protein
LESTSGKHRVTIATLTEWRDRFLAGGEAGLKSREVEPDDDGSSGDLCGTSGTAQYCHIFIK